jgi:hypothetical protein
MGLTISKAIFVNTGIQFFLFQENRREYEKRVASIVEQSWLIFGDETDGKEAIKRGGAAD